MAKKDNTVKSFILRVDADMMEATKGRTVEEEKTAPATKRRQVIKKA